MTFGDQMYVVAARRQGTDYGGALPDKDEKTKHASL